MVNKPIMEAVRQGKIGQFTQKAMILYNTIYDTIEE